MIELRYGCVHTECLDVAERVTVDRRKEEP